VRRKVIQDFANVFCQRILQLPEGYDLASFVRHGSGIYELNISTGKRHFNGRPIPKLRTCDMFREWLFTRLDQHLIPHESIELARLKIDVTVSQIEARQSYGHERAVSARGAPGKQWAA